MKFLDWLFLIIPLVIVLIVGLRTQRYMKSVADFMAGGRLAGPYLLAVGRGEMLSGAVVFVALFELTSRSGFTVTWWQWMVAPVSFIVAVLGFVIYRFRETRAMTLAQFFEIRYSKPFRVFTGLLGFVAGLMNFGIIPAIGARFFVHFLGLPAALPVFGFSLPTYIPLMALFLSITLTLTLSGGLITVMVTDCIEGIMSQLFYLVILAALLLTFSWPQISEVLAARPPGQSLLNPFDSLGNADFNLWYVLMALFVNIYGTMAWQNASAYNSAAISPHQSVMANILGRWRELGKMSVVTLLTLCAVTFLQHPDFAAQSAPAKEAIQSIGESQVRQQMEIPVALSYLLPLGVKGLLCAILLMGIFGGESTHLHSWGGIFVQDVLVPLRKKPFGPKQHIRALRFSIFGVALFAFLFGCLFRQTEYVIMWFSVTTAIYVGGAGAAIIGGLYWKRGTAAGAWSGLLTGSVLSVAGIIARQIYGNKMPLNGMEISFYATLCAIVAYVVVSLVTSRKPFNMDQMLHRGAYAKVSREVGEQSDPLVPLGQRFRFARLFGINSHFSRGDKWIAASFVLWSFFWCAVVLLGTIWNAWNPLPLSAWVSFWHVAGIGIPVLLTLITSLWFTWGGSRDIRDLFRRLREQKINHLDDGTVIGHQNLDEAAVSKKTEN